MQPIASHNGPSKVVKEATLLKNCPRLLALPAHLARRVEGKFFEVTTSLTQPSVGGVLRWE